MADRFNVSSFLNIRSYIFESDILLCDFITHQLTCLISIPQQNRNAYLYTDSDMSVPVTLVHDQPRYAVFINIHPIRCL